MAHHRTTVAEIDLKAFRNNLQILRKWVGSQVHIMAVVKADAYGHGALPCTRTALEAGAHSIGIGVIEEAIELRESGIDAPILVMTGILPGDAEDLVRHGLEVTVYSEKQLNAINQASGRMNKITPVHLKVDTGMGRLGVRPKDFPALAEKAISCKNIRLEGICTHLSSADEKDQTFTLTQLQILETVLSDVAKAGYTIPRIHCANSAGVLYYPKSWHDIIRPGLILYGALPSSDLIPVAKQVSKKVAKNFQPVMQWKSKIIQIKNHPPGKALSYGRCHITKRESRIATLPIGYADGLTRHLSNKLEVLIGGKRVPQVGNICMDMSLIDITDIPKAQVEDEVVIFGRQGDESISVEEVSERAGVVAYETLCAVGKRVPRRYIS